MGSQSDARYSCGQHLMFLDCSAVFSECLFSVPAPESHRSVVLLAPIGEVVAESYPIRTVIQFSICPSIGRQREGPKINPLNNQLGTFSQKKRRKFCKLFVNGTMIVGVLVKLFESKKRRSQRITPKAAPLYFGIRFLLSSILKPTIRNSNLCVTRLPVGIRVPLTRHSCRAR